MPKGNGTYAIANGQIAGRWKVGELLQAVQALTIGGKTVCPNDQNGYYSLLKSEACQYADIMNDPTQDLTGATCDSLSLGIGYTADPALAGSIVGSIPHGSLCYPEGGAPDADDTCGP